MCQKSRKFSLHQFEKMGYEKGMQLKFGYSDKATKSEKIFHLKFDITE